MGRYQSADQAMRAYLRLYENVVRGFDPFAMVGRQYWDKCPACKSVGKWRQQDGEWYCAASSCGAPRPWSRAGVMKGYFQQGLARISGKRVQMKPSARVRYDTAGDTLADLGQVWVVLTEWEHRLLALFVLVGGWAPLVRKLREDWPWMDWKERRARGIVKSARQKAERRMVRMGLMDVGDLAA